MSEPAIALFDSSQQHEGKSIEIISEKSGIEERIKDTHSDELIIGLCGPIGTDINFISESIVTELQTVYGYECHEIKLSDFIVSHFTIDKSAQSPINTKQLLIDRGNEMRKDYGNSILAQLAVNDLSKGMLYNKFVQKFRGTSVIQAYLSGSLLFFWCFFFFGKAY
jgi:pantothenate kinase-related protein Tda10